MLIIPLRATEGVVDLIVFGELASERAHALTDDRSQAIAGGLGQPARQLQAQFPASWEGGRVAFTLKVDPEQPNYVTAKFWGSDETSNILVLFCEGKQVGYRHLGDIDVLDIGGEGPAFPGRFFYTTTPLPLELTRGKRTVQLEIRSSGPIWGYGATFDKFQHALTEPTRGLYRVYSHTDGCFVPPADEAQGPAPRDPPIRRIPGPEVLDVLKDRVDQEVRKLLASDGPLNQMQMHFLARAYAVSWTSAYRKPAVVAEVIRSLDAFFAAYQANPRLAESDPATPNADWFGAGPSGDVISRLAGPLQLALDHAIADRRGGKITRRQAYSEMLQVCRDWHRRHRRLYTNQTMINDLYGIYLANRGVAAIDPAHALPEPVVRRYLYESVGLEPWRDSDPGAVDGPPEREGWAWGIGPNYWQLTPKGLTRELGYVGYYGEVLDWVTTIYEATRPAPDQPGDEKIRAQLIKMAHARAVFRAPGVDRDGNRAMRIEAVVGWRDAGHYPGDVAYGERTSWDGSALYAVAATLDPEGFGYAQQMLADNQFFALVEERMKERSLRVTAGLLEVPDQYERVRRQAASAVRLPMTPGQPDFVFSDEEDGVVAVKDGDAVLYVSLYWRARNAVNFLARVHYTTPRMDRIAIVREHAEFTPSGRFYTRPDYTIFGFGNGGPRYPVALHSAHGGEKLPIAKLPEGLAFKPGDESVYAGKASFYTLRYGPYLIAMNLSDDHTYPVPIPTDAGDARELVSGRPISTSLLELGPRSTVVVKFSIP